MSTITMNQRIFLLHNTIIRSIIRSLNFFRNFLKLAEILAESGKWGTGGWCMELYSNMEYDHALLAGGLGVETGM